MAAASPKGMVRRSMRQGLSDPETFEEFVAEKVEADTANFVLSDFSIAAKMKLKKKTTPAKALLEMTSLSAMSEVYRDTFNIYNRCLSRALDGLAKNSKEYRQLKAAAEALNLDIAAKQNESELVKVLARLRALELIQKLPH